MHGVMSEEIVEVTEIEDSAPNSPKDQDVAQSPIVVVPSDSEDNENPNEPHASYKSRKRSHSGRIRPNTEIKMAETVLQISNKIDQFVEVQKQIKQMLEEMLKLMKSYTRAEDCAGKKSVMSNAVENEPEGKQNASEESDGQEADENPKSKRGKLAQRTKRGKKGWSK